MNLLEELIIEHDYQDLDELYEFCLQFTEEYKENILESTAKKFAIGAGIGAATAALTTALIKKRKKILALTKAYSVCDSVADKSKNYMRIKTSKGDIAYARCLMKVASQEITKARSALNDCQKITGDKYILERSKCTKALNKIIRFHEDKYELGKSIVSGTAY